MKVFAVVVLLIGGIAYADVDIEFKPGKGLSVEDKGKFNITTRVRGQFRYTLSNSDELLHSLQLRRARLQFIGYMFNKHNKYKIEIAISPRDIGLKNGILTNTPLLSWYSEFDYLRDLTLRVGQYKVPYSRQRVISSGDLQLVDRSIVNAEFNLDRDIGLDLRSKDLFGLRFLRYYAGVYVGEGRDGFEMNDFGLMYLGRVEVLPFGDFKDYSEADLNRYSTPKLSLGVGYGFVENAKGNRGILGSVPSDGGTTDTHNVNGDVMFKWNGASIHSAFMWRKGKRNIKGDVELPRDGLGTFSQVGYVLPCVDLEVAGRYGLIRGLGETNLKDTNEVGGGVSYYFGGHSLKLQADFFHMWGSLTEDQFRLQLQAAL